MKWLLLKIENFLYDDNLIMDNLPTQKKETESKKKMNQEY